MKNRFRSYTTAWAVMLVLFNVIAFVSPGWIWFEKYDAAFWIGYAFISAAFLGQLACAYHALKEENLQKLFYNISLITSSYTGLILTFVVGGLVMLVSPLPYWIGILVCAVVLGFNVLAVIKAAAAIDEVTAMDQKIRDKTAFIRNLREEAAALAARAKGEDAQAACRKVCELLRYSDPTSSEALSDIEDEISARFAALAGMVAAGQSAAVTEAAEELLVLIEERNRKCRLNK